MSQSSRSPLSGPGLLKTRQLALANPDAVARAAPQLHRSARSNQQRSELWSLLAQVGGESTLKLAERSLLRSRSIEELEAILHAAVSDHWPELASAVARRFAQEIKRVPRMARAFPPHFEALALAVETLRAPLEAKALRILLRHPSARLRALGARLTARLERADLIDDVLPLCWQRQGGADFFACEILGRFGTARHAAELWPHVLSAHRQGQHDLFFDLLCALAEMGAFDIQLPLRVWMEEEAAHDRGADIWKYGRIWAQLVDAKHAAGACPAGEAIEELNVFMRTAGTASSPHGQESVQGVFHVAHLLQRLGRRDAAEDLVLRFAAWGLPSPGLFPTLATPRLRDWVQRHDPEQTAWLAAAGDADAQRRLVSGWSDALKAGVAPHYWVARHFISDAILRPVLLAALDESAPAVLRHTLCLLTGPTARRVADALEKLEREHPSAVIRWKAGRVLRWQPAESGAQNEAVTDAKPEDRLPRFVRLDAALLAGAIRPTVLERAARPEPARPIPGLEPVAGSPGLFRLKAQDLSAPKKAQLLQALLGAPLEQTLERRLPEGPSYEQRPDIQAACRPAPARNELDRRMAEMAQVVIDFWRRHDELLTLDEGGIGLVAAGLCSEARELDDEDVDACGAFIGEALRKQIGGEWAGFDDDYKLVVEGEVLDPIGWARELHAKKNPVMGSLRLAEQIQHALEMHRPPERINHSQAFKDVLGALGAMQADSPMEALMAQARSFAFRLRLHEWPAVLSSLEPMLDRTWVRPVAALVVYAPGETMALAWAQWGKARRKKSGLTEALAAAMLAAVERDDLEAMPNWTLQPSQRRYNFMNDLREELRTPQWRRVLPLLLRQRALAGDRSGAAWCLYCYRFAFSDCLPLLEWFCDMVVSARQTLIRASFHATRIERQQFRALWAEALRDPAPAVVLAALDVVEFNDVRSLRTLVEALRRDKREGIAESATRVLDAWEA